MRFDDKLGLLQDFALNVDEIVNQLDDVIEPDPTPTQIDRAARAREALRRTRSQISRLIAEIVIGRVSLYEEPPGR